MAADFKEGICPPQWCWDRVNELVGERKWYWQPNSWKRIGSPVSVLAAYIWRTEEPSVDPALEAVRDAIAVYEDRAGFNALAGDIREGRRDNVVSAAVASLRASGVLK